MTTMQWPDYVILAAFLVISLVIGVYHSMTGGKQRTTEEFIMANRKLGIIPTALSMFVSFKSAVMILGLTAEMYTFGVQYMIWGCVASAISLFIAERLFVPWLYPLKLISINDVSIRACAFVVKINWSERRYFLRLIVVFINSIATSILLSNTEFSLAIPLVSASHVNLAQSSNLCRSTNTSIKPDYQIGLTVWMF